MIFGDDGPAIAELADFTPPGVDHRLDGKDHAGFQPLTGARFAVVQDLRLFVKSPSDAMPAEFANDRKTQALSVALDGIADVAQRRSGAHLTDAQPHGVKGCLAKTLGSDGAVADDKHAAGIAMKAVFNDSDVDIDDIARFQCSRTWYAVADLMVDRRADRLRKGLIARRRVVERRWYGALLLNHVCVAQPIDFLGGNARPDVGFDEVKHLAGQPAGYPHGFDLFGGFDDDSHASIIG